MKARSLLVFILCLGLAGCTVDLYKDPSASSREGGLQGKPNDRSSENPSKPPARRAPSKPATQPPTNRTEPSKTEPPKTEPPKTCAKPGRGPKGFTKCGINSYGQSGFCTLPNGNRGVMKVGYACYDGTKGSLSSTKCEETSYFRKIASQKCKCGCVTYANYPKKP